MSLKSKLQRHKVPPQKLSKPQAKQENTRVTTSSSNNPSQTASGLDQEAEDQFELELCWCIQQLQVGLSDMKLQDKQLYNLTKSLNVLKSNNASLIKKRQVMRNTFGDYRSKMVEDEKKFGKTSSLVKFIPFNNKKSEKKSVFLKKAEFLKDTSTKDEEYTIVEKQLNKNVIINPDVKNEPFKFNFPGNET